jgi:hypothetical protein
VAELVHHFAALNGLAWAPHSPNHICTIADDRQALIWDITTKAPVSDAADLVCACLLCGLGIVVWTCTALVKAWADRARFHFTYLYSASVFHN